MKLISAAIMAMVGAAIMVSGAYHPHGDTSSTLSLIGAAVGLIAMGFWIREMLIPGS